MDATMLTPNQILSSSSENNLFGGYANDPISSSTSTTNTNKCWEWIPDDCRVEILNFLDNNDLLNVSLVSKKFHHDCHQVSIKTPIRPVYEILPRTGSFLRLVKTLWNRRTKDWAKFSRYLLIRVRHVDEFDSRVSEQTLCIIHAIATVAQKEEMNVTRVDQPWESLDLSLPIKTELRNICLPLSLCLLFPHIREIDLSNLTFPRMSNCTTFLEKLTRLEKITWKGSSNVYLMGWHFRGPTKKNSPMNNDEDNDDTSTRNTHLSELILDYSDFDVKSQHWLTAVSDIGTDTRPQAYSFYIFQSCSGEGLKGLSVRNTMCHCGPKKESIPVPQNALIKFVRNAPKTLEWFRSDLTDEHIEMLRKERPRIEFLN